LACSVHRARDRWHAADFPKYRSEGDWSGKTHCRKIIESFWADSGCGAEPLKLRNDNATIGELIAKYQQNAIQRPATVRSNIRSLQMIVKTVHGEDPDTGPTSLLTANLIRDFEKRQLERAG
jgi:hypothetical protein